MNDLYPAHLKIALLISAAVGPESTSDSASHDHYIVIWHYTIPSFIRSLMCKNPTTFFSSTTIN